MARPGRPEPAIVYGNPATGSWPETAAGASGEAPDRSGRRDSNPRPPPWQGCWDGFSDLRRRLHPTRELGALFACNVVVSRRYSVVHGTPTGPHFPPGPRLWSSCPFTDTRCRRGRVREAGNPRGPRKTWPASGSACRAPPGRPPDPGALPDQAWTIWIVLRSEPVNQSPPSVIEAEPKASAVPTRNGPSDDATRTERV